MPYALRLVGRRVGDGDGRAGAPALLRAAALAVIPAPQRRSLEVSEQHHVEHPKADHHGGEEQRNGTGERP